MSGTSRWRKSSYCWIRLPGGSLQLSCPSSHRFGMISLNRGTVPASAVVLNALMSSGPVVPAGVSSVRHSMDWLVADQMPATPSMLS